MESGNLSELKKSLSQLASERDAAAAAQQQRVAFLEAQQRRDQDELDRCKAQLADAYVASAGDRAAADKRHSVLDAQVREIRPYIRPYLNPYLSPYLSRSDAYATSIQRLSNPYLIPTERPISNSWL